jgi:hypothetical protein
MSAAQTTFALGARSHWTEVEEGFHVGNRGGEYAGSVSKVEDGFVAFDGIGTPVGRFPTVEQARASVDSVVPAGEPPAVRVARARLGMTAATIAAGVAGTLLLTAGVLAPWL